MTDDRDRGFLAPVDREFLRGEKSYEHRQSAYDRRQTIRKRVENAIYDFWLLAQTLDDREIDAIAERVAVDGPTHPISDAEAGLLSGTPVGQDGENRIYAAPGGFHRGFVSLIELLYRIYGDDEAAFEHLLEVGIHAGIERERDGLWSVNVDLEIEPFETADMDEIIERLEAGDHNSLNALERQVVLSRLAEQDAINLEALRRSRDRDEAAADAEPNDRKYVKRADGEFVKLDELDKELHELDEDRFEQLDETEKE